VNKAGYCRLVKRARHCYGDGMEPDESPQKNTNSFSEWRWPIVILALALIALGAYLKSLNTAKETALTTVDTVKEGLREVSNIAERFQQTQITHTFEESIPEVKGTGEGNLELATMKFTETLRRTNKRTVLWQQISLGTTVTEIKVPATFRYHLRLSDPWKLEVHGQQCVVIAPRLRASLPVAIHTDRMQKKSDEGWARWNADEQMTALERSLTPRLNGYAKQENHMRQVRETARGTVANFVKEWLLKEDHWRTNRFRSIRVIFADEAEAHRALLNPTLELN
jgi:hypothetical protein